MKDSDKKLIDRLNTCSMEEFLKEIGVICYDSIYAVVRFDSPTEDGDAFYKRLQSVINFSHKNLSEIYDSIVSVFCDYAHCINRSAYIAEANALVKDRKNIITDEKGRIIYHNNDNVDPSYSTALELSQRNIAQQRKIQNIARLFDYIPVDCVRSTDRQVIVSDEKDFTEETQRQIKRNVRRIEENKVLFEEVIRNTNPWFVQNAGKYQGIMKAYLDTVKRQYGIDVNEDFPEGFQFSSPSENEIIYNLIKDNLKYFDLDRVVLASIVTKIVNFQNSDEKTKEMLEEIRKYANRVKVLIKDRNSCLSYYQDGITIDSVLAGIDECGKCFINGEYCSSEAISKFRDSLMKGQFTYDSVLPEDYVNTFNFNNGELARIILNDANAIKFFYENKIISDDYVRNIINDFLTTNKNEFLLSLDLLSEEERSQMQLDFGIDTIKYLHEHNLLSSKDSIELYLNGYIEQENMNQLVMDNELQIGKEFNNQRLIELYFERDTEETEERFNKFARMYKKVNLENGTQDDKNKFSSELIELVADRDLDEKHLFDLYRRGLITCDVLLDFVGVSALRDIYASGELKPTDARRLYYEGIITDDMLDDIFSSKEIEDGKKLHLIYETFSSQEDEEKRNDLIKYLSEVQKPSTKREKHDHVIRDRITVASKKYITDQCYRWQLILALDKEANSDYISDGHEVIYLPTLGKVVIEKLFEAGNAKNPSYGTATYILDDSFYRANKNLIVVDDKIQRSFLASLMKDEKALRVNHSKSWDKKICQIFEVETSSMYNDTEKKKIKELAETVANSRRVYRE